MATKKTAKADKKKTDTQAAAAPKRKRGRPPKPKYASDDFLEKKAEEIIEIVIENGITDLGEFAFWYCVNAETVSIPDSVKSLGAYTSANATV